MKRYEFSKSRTLVTVAAAAMTVSTLGLSVIVPLEVASGRYDARAVEMSKAAPSAVTEVAITPYRLDVVGERTQKTAYGPARQNVSKRDQAS